MGKTTGRRIPDHKNNLLRQQSKGIASRSEQLALSVYITPSHIQPVLSMNQYFRYADPGVAERELSNTWQIEITLNNISLGSNEALLIETLNSNYISRRLTTGKNA